MAVMPTIASTSSRRLLPTADLQIEGATPAAFGAGLGAGLQALGGAGQEAAGALAQLQLAKEREAEQLAEFDRQAQFVTFGSEASQRLDEEVRNLDGPAQDFTKNTMARFDADAASWLEKVPQRLRPQWQARFAQLRSGVAAQALRAEFGQRDAWTKTTLGDNLDRLANGAAQSPDQAQLWREQGEALINSSLLSPTDKLDALSKWRANVALAAAQGDVQRDPEGAIKRLGGFDTEVTVVQGEGGQAAIGAVFDSLVQQESGGRAGVVGPQTEYGRALGATQLLPATAQEMARKLGVAYDEALLRGTSPEAKAYQLKLGRAYFEEGLAKYNGDVRKALMYYHGGPDEAKWGPKTRRYAREVLDRAGASESGRSLVRVDRVGTGEIDPRYADLPVSARMQLIGAAQREQDRRENEVAVAENRAHSEWLNDFYNDLNDGKAGMADIEAARRSGRLTDFDEINRAQQIAEARNREASALTAFNGMLNTPGFTWNPFDEGQQKAVEAGVAEMAKQPGKDGQPMGAAMAALNVWQRTGVLAKSGAVALRGAMISTDPARVAGGASIAANMLARNPNAFAAVEGGEEIERNAQLYSHYVNDLGMSSESAAEAVAKLNTPEMRAKIKMGQPEMQAFRRDVQKTDVQGVLGKALDTTWFDGSPTFLAPEQRVAASQDYADLAADHFQRYGDPTAAKAFALSQMRKFYGVVNGRLMKYPPTRAYPAIGGGHDYVFRQAAEDIKAVTKRDVAPENVFLMPVPGATAEAFRAGRPVPYAVHYVDEVGGQKVYRVLNGRAFYADPQQEARRVGAERKAQFDAERRRATVPSLQDIRRANPRRPGEGTWEYSQRMGFLLDQAQRAAR